MDEILGNEWNKSYKKFGNDVKCSKCDLEYYNSYRYVSYQDKIINLCETCFLSEPRYKNIETWILVRKEIIPNQKNDFIKAIEGFDPTNMSACNKTASLICEMKDCNNKNRELPFFRFLNEPKILCSSCYSRLMIESTLQRIDNVVIIDFSSYEISSVDNFSTLQKVIRKSEFWIEKEGYPLGKIPLKSYNLAKKSPSPHIKDEEFQKIIRCMFRNEVEFYKYNDTSFFRRCYSFDEEGDHGHLLLEESKITLTEALNISPDEKNYPKRWQRFHWLCNIIYGLNYLHQRGYIYQALSPDNIYIVENEAKLGNFELLIKKSEAKKGNPFFRISPKFWAAPELLDEKTESYDEKVDIFSLGLLVNFLFTGELHQAPARIGTNIKSILRKDFEFSYLVEAFCKMNPKERDFNSNWGTIFDFHKIILQNIPELVRSDGDKLYEKLFNEAINSKSMIK